MMMMIKKCTLAILIVLVFATNSCLNAISKEVLPKKPSAEELKTLQIRDYDKNYNLKLMKAILNVLQDDYYFITQADSQIGFIFANKEFDTRDKYIDIKKEFGCSKKMTGIKRYSITRTEADINVTPYPEKTQVRISFRKKILNMYDMEIRVKDITDKIYYDNFYSKLDKELQLNANK